MFKIEKGVPYKQGTKNGNHAMLKETLQTMEIGDSIVVPYRMQGLWVIAQRLKIKISSKSNKDGTYRVWRTG